MDKLIYNPSNMSTWKTKTFDKKRKGSQTPGKRKNEETCQATVDDKYFARRSRSYKDKDYWKWCAKTRKLNGQ